MPHIYFDESIQDKGDFIIGAFVYGMDAENPVSKSIKKVGLRPGVDEYKSSTKMISNPKMRMLREEFCSIIQDYKLGVVVLPRRDREGFGKISLLALKQFMATNELGRKKNMEVFMDQGIFLSVNSAQEQAKDHKLSGFRFHPEQDSKKVKGLQIADFVAHTVGIMLMEYLGLMNKKVKIGNQIIQIGFEMWSKIRYAFFNSGKSVDAYENLMGQIIVGDNGLFIAKSCQPRLRKAALGCFGKNYLGCIN